MIEQDFLQSNIGFCTEMENEYAGIIIVSWEMRLLSRAGGQVMFGRLVTNFEDIIESDNWSEIQDLRSVDNTLGTTDF